MFFAKANPIQMAKKRINVLQSVVALASFAALIQSSTSMAQSLRVSEVKKLANGQTQVTATGTSANSVVLESSSDLKSWSPVTTFPANSSAMSYTDAAGGSPRFYRLRDGAVQPAPAQLTDLATMPNRVFAAPEGAATVQYAPDGKLAFVAWRDHDLIVRERTTAGAWTEAVVNSLGNTFVPLLTFDFSGARNDFSFQPSVGIAYDSQSRLHIFQGYGKSIIHYTRNGSTWTEAERIADNLADSNIAVLEVAVGAGDVFHFAALSAGWSRNLTYGSNRGGSWNFVEISKVQEAPMTYWAPPFAPRWLSLAVDSRNGAHIAFRSEMTTTYDLGGHPRAYSELKYASNASGGWNTTLIMTPFDQSAEADNGSSIAVGPDDKPYIVSWYDERADSGSAQESRLYFHQRDAAGNWSYNIIAQTPDNYIAGDGAKGTGFSPYLRFDNRGRAHIVFLDHAGEHFSNIGQQEYAGNLRHAWLEGGVWSSETLFRQTNPLLEQGVFPAFAMSGSELAVTFVERKTQWNLSSYPPMSNSTYYFRFMTKPLQ
jgi:hypothetical protein